MHCKENMRQQEVKAEFNEGIERVQVLTEYLGDSERREGIIFAGGPGFLLRTVVGCMCLLGHPGTN